MPDLLPAFPAEPYCASRCHLRRGRLVMSSTVTRRKDPPVLNTLTIAVRCTVQQKGHRNCPCRVMASYGRNIAFRLGKTAKEIKYIKPVSAGGSAGRMEGPLMLHDQVKPTIGSMAVGSMAPPALRVSGNVAPLDKPWPCHPWFGMRPMPLRVPEW